MTLQQTDVSSPVYWRQPFESLATVSDLTEFIVLDIEPTGISRGKYVLADAQVTRASGGTASDDMGDDGIYHTRTHLGGILQPGDTVLGYHLTHSNFNSEAFEGLDDGRIPDVILVKKTYPNRRKKSKARNWKLRSIAKEAEDVNENTVGRGALGRRGGVDQKNVERDYELFLRDLEEDKEMRAAINLYKDQDAHMVQAKSGAKGKRRQQNGGTAAPGDMEVEEEIPETNGTDADDEDEDGEEEDFPEVSMDELLEHFEEMDVGDDAAEEIE